MLNNNFKWPRAIITQSIACWLMMLAVPLSVFGQAPASAKSTVKASAGTEWQTPIRFFQRTFSRADGHRCAMHPSCSQYASTAFKTHNLFMAWILTSDRLLRCGHDEIRKAPHVIIHGERKAYDPLTANTFWWSKPGGKP